MPLAQASTAVYLVLTLQTLWGLGATVAGAFNASLALAWSFTAIVVANLSPSANRATFIASGPVLLVAGLATIVAGLVSDHALVALAGQIAIGAGFGIAWAFLSQAVMEDARARRARPGVERAADAAVGRLCRRRGAGRARRQRCRLHGH